MIFTPRIAVAASTFVDSVTMLLPKTTETTLLPVDVFTAWTTAFTPESVTKFLASPECEHRTRTKIESGERLVRFESLSQSLAPGIPHEVVHYRSVGTDTQIEDAQARVSPQRLRKASAALLSDRIVA